MYLFMYYSPTRYVGSNNKNLGMYTNHFQATAPNWMPILVLCSFLVRIRFVLRNIIIMIAEICTNSNASVGDE